MNERRLARLQEQIKERLASILQRDLADPKLGLVTITRVELDPEFTQCKAYWSVIAPTAAGEAKARTQSAEVLARARSLCQREMGKGLATRTVPHLEFVHDEGISGAVRVNRLLKDLADERAQREQSHETPADAGTADTADTAAGPDEPRERQEPRQPDEPGAPGKTPPTGS